VINPANLTQAEQRGWAHTRELMIAERAVLEQQRNEGLEEEKLLGARRLLEHQLWLREAKVSPVQL
jgi:hypothetical protein